MSFTATPGNQLLRQQVYAHLRKALKSEKLKPGNTVRINQLGEALGISRTPLRDALLQLQAEGFVTFLPQRGILINELSEKEIKDIYEMLGALDSRGLLSVFSRIGSDEIQKMKALNEEMLLQVKNQAYFEYFDLNTAFHNIYLNLSDNMLLLNQLNILRQRLFDFVTKGEWIKKVQVLNCQEHLKLIELIADEATSALDVTVQAHILKLLRSLCRRKGTAIMFITHDLGIAAQMCDRVAVMYSGRIIETAPTSSIFETPRHPYTRGLLAAVPRLGSGNRLTSIPGMIPDLANLPEGCRFHPRCTHVMAHCKGEKTARAGYRQKAPGRLLSL